MKKLIIPVFIVLLYLLMNSYIKNIELNGNTNFINKLLKISNYHFNNNEIEKENLIDPVFLIEKVFAYEDIKPVFNENTQEFNYMKNNKKVYIYSTHPNESYIDSNTLYGMDFDIVEASKLLKDELEKLGIDVVVEDKRADNYIKENNLKFKDSYLATREFIKERLSDNYDLIIDLHRDEASKTTTTAIIDNKNYAKVMFVNNINYENKNISNKINNIILKNYPNLSRGIYKKYVSNFNQDLANNIILIELGGNKNTLDEVLNTIPILALSIGEYLYER